MMYGVEAGIRDLKTVLIGLLIIIATFRTIGFIVFAFIAYKQLHVITLVSGIKLLKMKFRIEKYSS